MINSVLSIEINVPIEKLFEYTINPGNTNFWIDSIEKEWIEGHKEIDIGIVYKNKRLNGKTYRYKLIEFQKNKLFHLKSLDSDMDILYKYTELNLKKTKLDYYINTNDSNILISIKKSLQKLKFILE